MRLIAALGLLALSTAALAQPTDPVRRKAERDLLEKIVEIPTVAGRGQMPRMTALLTAELKKAGISDIVVKSHDDTQTMIARWHAAKPSSKKPILLMAHMDVVEAKASDWKYDPFVFRQEGGYYLGRGVNDNKAGLAGIVLALQDLKRAGFRPTRDIIVLFTGDEETTGNGALRASTEWRPLIDAEYALNSDSGGGSLFKDGRVEGFFLQIAEKTYADYRFLAINRGGHSSAPRPDNAIYQLANALTAVEHYRFKPMINDASRAMFERLGQSDTGNYGELVRRWLKDPTDREAADLVEANDLGKTRTRCVATMLSGGHAPNALPQRAEANVNCRIFPGVTPEAIRDELQAVAGQDVTVDIKDKPTYSAASPLRQDVLDAYAAAVATRIKDAPILPFMEAGASDGAFTRAAGIPTYGVSSVWGYSGESDNIHGLNERVLIDGFHGQMPIWEELIRRLAG